MAVTYLHSLRVSESLEHAACLHSGCRGEVNQEVLMWWRMGETCDEQGDSSGGKLFSLVFFTPPSVHV